MFKINETQQILLNNTNINMDEINPQKINEIVMDPNKRKILGMNKMLKNTFLDRAYRVRNLELSNK